MMMNFSKALNHLKRGRKITRKTWVKDTTKGDCWLEIQNPKEGDVEYTYISVVTANGHTLWWQPEHVDLLAEDWIKRGWTMKLLPFIQKSDQNNHERIQHDRTE